MTNDLVERVAKAIEPEEGYWQHFLPGAKAAIAVVLREIKESPRYGCGAPIIIDDFARENNISLSDEVKQ